MYLFGYPFFGTGSLLLLDRKRPLNKIQRNDGETRTDERVISSFGESMDPLTVSAAVPRNRHALFQAVCNPSSRYQFPVLVTLLATLFGI
jgi:hypothetical protein